MIFEKVCDVITDTLSCERNELKKESRLKEDLGIDSLDAVELNMALEDAFHVEIDDEALAAMKTVGDITDYLAERQ